jgi:hypothetical protein
MHGLAREATGLTIGQVDCGCPIFCVDDQERPRLGIKVWDRYYESLRRGKLKIGYYPLLGPDIDDLEPLLSYYSKEKRGHLPEIIKVVIPACAVIYLLRSMTLMLLILPLLVK